MKFSRQNFIIIIFAGLTGIGIAWGLQIVDQPDYLRNARQEDLVRILDELTTREDDLSREVRRLDSLASELRTGN